MEQMRLAGQRDDMFALTEYGMRFHRHLFEAGQAEKQPF